MLKQIIVCNNDTYFANVDITDSEMISYLREQLQKQFVIQLL